MDYEVPDMEFVVKVLVAVKMEARGAYRGKQWRMDIVR
jgi:hypothetical protein